MLHFYVFLKNFTTDFQDKVYVTPMDLAVDRNHSDIAKFLSANGALTMAKIVGIAATRDQS